MGKAGRIACIITPMALSLASLICLLLVFIGSTSKTGANSDIYFMKADTSGLKNSTSTTDLISGTDVDDEILSLLESNAASNISDFYQVGIWNYCSGDKNTTGGETITYCSSRQTAYWFNPVEVWGLEDSGLEDEIPDSLQKGLKIYKKVAKWMFAAYAIAFWLTVAEIAVGIFAIFSRWGSCVTTIVTSLSTTFTIAASITSTALYSTLVGTFDSVLKSYDIDASLGKNMMICTWLAVVFSIAAGLFWFLSSCCCSGKSDRRGRKSLTVEKTPYTYERVESPYVGHPDAAHTQQHGAQVPLRNMGDQRHTAYEPFRHDSRV